MPFRLQQRNGDFSTDLSQLKTGFKCSITSRFHEDYDMRPLLLLMPKLQELSLLQDPQEPDTAQRCDVLLKYLVVGAQDSEPPLLPALNHLRIVRTKFNPALLAQVVECRPDAGVAFL
ncbi:hypothetical protein BDV98DRAFT_568901 [Pterulicium gracile]|uniref:Uncharacterized protein n=1 Tax=Pterulicium gracile TaxID=1884261 RepID=A0A5C3QGN9_9AGAR|nr:hypothetical protein BDV98DRAFT_568901 [Pterula gracilis]